MDRLSLCLALFVLDYKMGAIKAVTSESVNPLRDTAAHGTKTGYEMKGDWQMNMICTKNDV